MCEWIILEVWARGAEVRRGEVKESLSASCLLPAHLPAFYFSLAATDAWILDPTKTPFGMWKEGRREGRKKEGRTEMREKGREKKYKFLAFWFLNQEGLTETLKYLSFSYITLLYKSSQFFHVIGTSLESRYYFLHSSVLTSVDSGVSLGWNNVSIAY